MYHRIKPWTRRRCNTRFHRRQRHRLDGCETGLIFRRQCLVRRISAMSAVCLMRVSRRVSLRGCRKPMRQCSSNTPLSQRSTMSTLSAARGICTALCRSTRTRRLQSTVCNGTKKHRPMRSQRFSTGQRAANRCCSLRILTALRMRPTPRSLSPTTTGTPANGIPRLMR